MIPYWWLDTVGTASRTTFIVVTSSGLTRPERVVSTKMILNVPPFFKAAVILFAASLRSSGSESPGVSIKVTPFFMVAAFHLRVFPVPKDMPDLNLHWPINAFNKVLFPVPGFPINITCVPGSSCFQRGRWSRTTSSPLRRTIALSFSPPLCWFLENHFDIVVLMGPKNVVVPCHRKPSSASVTNLLTLLAMVTC